MLRHSLCKYVRAKEEERKRTENKRRTKKKKKKKKKKSLSPPPIRSKAPLGVFVASYLPAQCAGG
jgi:hypothetical protein